MIGKCVLVLFLYLNLTFEMQTEVFSSISKMELLLLTQKNVIDTLKYFISSNYNKNKILKNYLRRFETEHVMAMMDIPRYIGNPVNCYRLIKRLTVDIKLIEKVLIGISDYKRNKSVIYPSKEDLIGAVQGLLHIEFIYGLNKTNMAAGVWNTSYNINRQVSVELFNPMTISDCYELGKLLYNFKLYDDGIGWLMEARNKYDDKWNLYPEDYHIDLEDIVKLIKKGNTSSEKELLKWQNWLREITAHIPNIDKIEEEVLVNYYERGLKTIEVVKAINSDYNDRALALDMNITLKQLDETSTGLCKGELNSREEIIRNAKCYVVRGPHPFLKLAPIKAELLNRDPLVVLFREVIYDSEIKALKEYALPRLKRGNVYMANPKSNHSFLRTCQVAKVMNNEPVLVHRIKSRIEQFSGMKLATSEELQIVNYGIGGQCKLHHDYWDNDLNTPLKGPRMATALFYLSDVEQGGATIFPILGNAVFPVKGAALYWVNLLPSGRGDPRTYHAACPVLQGSKWVLTQWINQYGQELNWPCPRNSKSSTDCPLGE